MKKLLAVFMGVFVFSGVFFCFLAPVSAQEFPKENIRFVVGYAPGGGFDIYARAMAKVMEKFLPKGLHVIVDNKPGGASQVAASAVYNAVPDGHMIAILPMPGLYVPQMFFSPKYDVTKITWLGTVLKEDMCLAISEKSKFKTLKELQEAQEVRITLTGFSGPEIAAPISLEKLGIKAKYITGHKGSKEALLAAMRGDGDAVVFTYGSLRQFFQKKTFIPVLLLGAEKRNPEIPDVPTAAEIGYADLDDLVPAWRSIGAPPGLPDPLKKQLRDLIWKTMNDPEFLEWSKTSEREVSPIDGEKTEKALAKVVEKYAGLKDLLERYMK